MNNSMSKCLWFNGQAKEAASFYCSVFKDAKIKSSNSMVTSFDLRGTSFLALNGCDRFKINPSISFFVYCGGDAEIERLYSELIEGGFALMPLG
jgi:predicted 3-demethylubiquinone-9 3-methyltransferase (glyoxalase superfamily)